MNELLDYVVIESSENLQRLQLNEIPGKAQYDSSVLRKFVPKSQSLVKLLIEPEKNEGLEQGTIALSNMAIKIIQMKPPLVELSLHNLGNTEQGVNIFDALCSTSAEATTMSLSHLSLTGNPQWFLSQACVDMVANFVQQQEHLENLILNDNYLTARSIAQILGALNDSPSKDILKKINLERCSWDLTEAQKELAKLLAEAPKLEICMIKFQTGLI